MDQIVALVKSNIDNNGELHLNKIATESLIRWLGGVTAVIDSQLMVIGGLMDISGVSSNFKRDKDENKTV